MSKNIPPQQPGASTKTSLMFSEGTGKLHHIPVLLQSVVELLAPQQGESYLDLTAGFGGHARAILSITEAPEKAVLVDRDKMAIDALKEFLALGAGVIHDDYAHFAEQAVREGKQFNMILVDLGVSSPQLDKAQRGFSLKRDGPLDMRMDQRFEQTAETMVNHMSKDQLQDVIERYGEEPRKRANAIATAIVAARPVHTTQELANVILKTHRGAYQKTHPATRTFQALRIALNDELGQLERLLAALPKLLVPGGRAALISFHSLEDRLVKRFFKEQASAGYEAELVLLGKAVRGKHSDDTNPRARSATLRAVAKT